MKKYMITFSLLFIPFMSIAADHCTNPSEYTTDRRCYVTDKQKKTKPYNSVVALIDSDGEVFCTGILVAFSSPLALKTRFLITAKHCIEDSAKPQTVRLQDGRELNAKLIKTTDIDTRELGQGASIKDWGIYGFGAPVSISTDIEPVYIKHQETSNGIDISVVGYGALKIMSDAEISEFKQKYVEYLEQNNLVVGTDVRQRTYPGIRDSDGGIRTNNSTVNDFIYNVLADNPATYDYGLNIFADEEQLKISKCKFNDKQDICQLWSGNSGGPLFDDKNNLIGIASTGYLIIGGENHAAMGDIASMRDLYESGRPDIVVTETRSEVLDKIKKRTSIH